ncbi:MAG TPA: DUF882 domain-containing protein [Gammaproteobacteria bacterium]|nr:DUF882 domain-containing protein [Gammaproteobacteria bacterium]
MKLTHHTRRRFLKTLLGTTAVLASPSLWASLQRAPERSLVFRNLHTGESLRSTFWVEGQYLDAELSAVNRILRDHRSGEVHRMDPKLLDLLYVLQQSVGVGGAYHVISGYRSPATNRKLQSRSSGVAKRSLHMQGRAIDIRLPGCDLGQLRNAALSLKAGGVGYYAKSDFIHVDTGRVRRW